MSRPTTRSRRAGGRLVPAENRFADRGRGRRRRRLVRSVVLLLVAAALGGAVWVVLYSSLLALTGIEVSGVPKDKVAAIRDLVDVPQGTPLARVDTGAVARRVADRPDVAHVTVGRTYPGTLTVRVTLRQPVLAVRGPGGDLRLVDIEGVDYETATTVPSGVPVVGAASGTVSKEGVQAALSMLAVLPADLQKKAHHLEVSDADILRFSIGRTRVVWGTGDRPSTKARTVQVLLRGSPHLIDVSAPDTPVTR